MSYLQNFNYRIYGNKSQKRLVFLHGLMGYGRNWHSIARHFEKDYQILTFDQRGHGESFQPEEGYGPDDYANDLNKILEELKWQKIILIGHSMGGRNAIEFSYKYPEKTKALVVVDIGPDFNHEAIEKIEGIFQKAPTPFESKEEAKAIIEDQFEPVLAAYLFSNIQEQEDGKFSWRFFKHGILESLYKGRESEKWQQWQAISCPTLLIRGANSEDLSEATYNKMLETNPNTKGQTIADTGHWVHYEQREAFCASLEDFFQTLPSVNT